MMNRKYKTILAIGAAAGGAFLMVDFSLTVNLGAMIFVFSDTVIAVNKFLRPIPHSTVFNIGLYFIAQFLIVIGLISRANQTRST